MITAIVFPGCQKVINVDLANETPQLVIQGLITDSIGPYKVYLNKSGSYFNQPKLPAVSHAVVVITDNTGTIDTLKERIPGIYYTSKIRGIPGRTYTLVVVSENKRYTAVSTMHNHVVIDSLKLEKNQSQGFGFGGGGRNGDRVEIHCIFNDPLEKNFYRIKITTNDTINTMSYRLYDDQYTNGEHTDLQVARAKVGDVSFVELISLDNTTYEYYRTLRDILRSNPIFGSTPANPNTNLTNGALGYFGAYAVSTKRIVITNSLFNGAK
jgi:hypothetical protein